MHNLPGGKKNARASLQYLGTWLSGVARERGNRREVAGKRFWWFAKSAVGCFRKRVEWGTDHCKGTKKQQGEEEELHCRVWRFSPSVDI